MAGALALVALPSRGQAAPASPGYVTACQRADGRFAVLLLDADGRVTADWPLSARAHDIAWNAATGFAVAFARQPGRFAVAFRPGRKQKPSLFAPPRRG